MIQILSFDFPPSFGIIPGLKTQTMSTEVFVSYSSQDYERVMPLVDRLRSAGVSIWVDEGNIDAATLWWGAGLAGKGLQRTTLVGGGEGYELVVSVFSINPHVPDLVPVLTNDRQDLSGD